LILNARLRSTLGAPQTSPYYCYLRHRLMGILLPTDVGRKVTDFQLSIADKSWRKFKPVVSSDQVPIRR
jgi:hypothetical protein